MKKLNRQYEAEHRTLLRKHGFRATPQKLAILAVLANVRRPLAAAQLHGTLGEAMDIATLYRNLEAFTHVGIVRALALGRGRAQYFELARDHHHHIVCRRCGKVSDTHACEFTRAKKHALARAPDFASIEAHSFEFLGTCKPCARTE